MNSFIICEDSAYNDIILNMDNIAFIHPATRTAGLNCVHFDGNGVVELSEGSIDKLIDSIPVRDKPAKTVTVRTRLL